MRASMEFVERYYAEYVADLDRVESQWARQHLREVSGSYVLNVGCGPQLYDDAAEFATTPTELVGIDINESNIEFLKKSTHPRLLQSKKVLNERGTRIELLVHDIRLKRKEFVGRFDSIYASSVVDIFNRKDTAHILELLFQYLEPSGRLVLIWWDDDRLTSTKYNQRVRYGWYQRNGVGRDGLETLLRKTGFTIIKRDAHAVTDPIEYEWGLIYCLISQK
jgi:SAM-dependent methyltransferase